MNRVSPNNYKQLTHSLEMSLKTYVSPSPLKTVQVPPKDVCGEASRPP